MFEHPLYMVAGFGKFLPRLHLQSNCSKKGKILLVCHTERSIGVEHF